MRGGRAHITANMPTYVFLTFFCLTAVVANIAYLTPWGRDWPSRSISDFDWTTFRVQFQVAFWALVLLPFAVTPVVAILTRRLSQPLVTRTAGYFRDFPKPLYCVVCGGLYAYVFYSLYRSDALHGLLSAANAVQAGEARFETLAALGFWPQMAMKSLLVFLTVYAAVKAARRGGRFWAIALIWHSVALTISLILLNMKWPVVVFEITLGLSVLVTARRYPLLKSGAVMTLAVVTYFLIAVVLLRMAPLRSAAASVLPLAPTASAPRGGLLPPGVQLDIGLVRDVVDAARHSMPVLAVQAFNRMGIALPYYYEVFTVEGRISGTTTDRLLRRPYPQEPSALVYARMFKHDGFEGRGTAPAAVHITGYALDGWAGAASFLTLGSIVIGLFLALWPAAQTNDLFAAAFVMGGYAGYFLSQLPFEAALIYDHGMLWWLALVIGQVGCGRHRRGRGSG